MHHARLDAKTPRATFTSVLVAARSRHTARKDVDRAIASLIHALDTYAASNTMSLMFARQMAYS